jgi:hypothetical protein
MNGLRRFGVFGALFVVMSFGPPGAEAQNLARYRDFEFGMSVDSVAKQTQLEPARVRTVHTVPDLIQTLLWDRQTYFSSSTATDPVRSIRFDFYNNQLFKIVTIYANQKLQGMTADDLIEAISKTYGVSSRPDESIVLSPHTGYEELQKVLARWENDENIYSLFQSPYGEFGLMADSKKLDVMAARSIQEAERLEALAAPQREIERRQKEAEERRIMEEKAGSVNRPNFRP